MNRIEMILKLADDGVNLTPDKLHIFLLRALKMLGDAELVTLQLKQDVEAAKQL